MGKSYTPTYRIEVKDNTNGDKWLQMAWRGRASGCLLLSWVHKYNQSHKSYGVNFHITQFLRDQGKLGQDAFPVVTEARIIRQATNEVEYTYNLSEDGTGSARWGSPEVPFTVKSVKEFLPQITVDVNGEVMIAEVAGRKNDFATIYYANTQKVEASWEAVKRAANTGNPIII